VSTSQAIRPAEPPVRKEGHDGLHVRKDGTRFPVLIMQRR
jgi:hypothetical protein